MDKRRIFVVFGILLLVVIGAAFTTYRANQEIHRVQMEAAALRAQRDSIAAVSALRDSLRTVLNRATDSLDQRSDVLRARVSALEVGREAAELAVWQLGTSDDTERAFRDAFPEFAPVVRVTEYQPDGARRPLRYMMLPANTAQSFMAYRIRADSLELTRDVLQHLVVLRDSVVDLKDSVIALTMANEAAYKLGYDSAFAKSQQLASDYVELLRKPRFGVNVPTLATVVAALGVGFGGGVAVGAGVP